MTNHFAMTLLSILFIGNRMHALALFVHEAAHYRLHPNRKINNLIGKFLSTLFFFSFENYQETHKKHHVNKMVNTENDPDYLRKGSDEWNFPLSKRKFLFIIFKDLSGLGIYDLINELKFNHNIQKQKKEKQSKVLTTFVTLFSIAFLYKFNLLVDYIIFWFIPALTSLKLFLRLRAINDHYGKTMSSGFKALRNTHLSHVTSFFLAPYSSSLHADHHLFPNVPFYHLKKLHTLLDKNPDYRSAIYQTNGVKHLAKEILN